MGFTTDSRKSRAIDSRRDSIFGCCLPFEEMGPPAGPAWGPRETFTLAVIQNIHTPAPANSSELIPCGTIKAYYTHSACVRGATKRLRRATLHLVSAGAWANSLRPRRSCCMRVASDEPPRTARVEARRGDREADEGRRINC